MRAEPIRVILLHGIESAGVQSVDRVGHELTKLGYHVEDVQLKPTFWWSGRKTETWRENLKRIMAVAKDGDNVVAHSNGCRLCWDIMDGGNDIKFDNLFWFAPPLDSDVRLRSCRFNHLEIFANPYDLALLAGSLLPGHVWGPLGRKGYTGKNVVQVRTHWYPSHQKKGHGHYFEPDYLPQMVALIHNQLSLGVPPEGGA